VLFAAGQYHILLTFISAIVNGQHTIPLHISLSTFQPAGLSLASVIIVVYTFLAEMCLGSHNLLLLLLAAMLLFHCTLPSYSTIAL